MKLAFALLACPLLFACSNDGALDPGRTGGSRGVVQAGAQDIAYFRALVEAGEVPAPEVLDEVGFFAEHALDQPPADCGSAICAHPMLAVAPRFDEGTWTMAFVSLNSSVDPATRPRAPVHAVIAVERSPDVLNLLGGVPSALDEFIDSLAPEDRVSVVVFGDAVEVVAEAVAQPNAPELSTLLPRQAASSVDLYAGIAKASELATQESEIAEDSRIVLLTTGAATGGITDTVRIEELAASIVREGTAFSVIGMGSEFRAELPVRLSDLGAGSYSYAESRDDLAQILANEASLALIPLATDAELRVVPAPGYGVGRLYGAKRARVENDGAELDLPALFLGARSGADDGSMGRRGGGGGLFVELVADPELGRAIGPGESAFRLEGSYVDVDSGQTVEMALEVTNELAPGARPAELWPSFSAPEYGKAFMMLNVYLALKAVLELYASGDCGSAVGVVMMMDPGIAEWQRRFSDVDIDADWTLLRALGNNVAARCDSQPQPPSNFVAGCFAI